MLTRLAQSERPVVDVSARSVGDKLAFAVAGPASKADPYECSFKNCRLGGAGVRAIADALGRECTRLKSLDLSENKLRSKEATDALITLVAKDGTKVSETLETVKLANCGIPARAGADLALAWRDRDGPTQLRVLDLAATLSTATGTSWVSAALKDKSAVLMFSTPDDAHLTVNKIKNSPQLKFSAAMVKPPAAA